MLNLRQPLWHTAVALTVIGWPVALVTLTPGVMVGLMVTGATLGAPLAVCGISGVIGAGFGGQFTPGNAERPRTAKQMSFGYFSTLATCGVSGTALVGLAGAWQLLGWCAGQAALSLVLLETGIQCLREVARHHPAASLASSRPFVVTDSLTCQDLVLAWQSSTAALDRVGTVAECLRLVEVRVLYLDLLLEDMPEDINGTNASKATEPPT